MTMAANLLGSLRRRIGSGSLLARALMVIRAVVEASVYIARQRTSRSVTIAGRILRLKPRYTMVTLRHLVALVDAIEDIERNGVAGDIVECGVWNGGSAALMSATCRDLGATRGIWLYDSFEGLPEPSTRDGEDAGNHTGTCLGSVEMVGEAFRSLGVDPADLRIIKGWFDDTLPSSPVTTIALLHVDADWYESVRKVLEVFYDRVAPGGHILFDDYGYWAGCRAAVDEFMALRGIGAGCLTRIDADGALLVKPAA